MALYMKVPGIDGSVTAKGYEKWIELTSMDFSVERAVRMDVGNVSNRKTGLPDFEAINISKTLDESSYGLLKEAVMASKAFEVEINVCDSGPTPKTFMKYVMTDCFFTKYEMSGSGGPGAQDEPLEESGSISFSKIEVTFTPSGKDGAAGGPAIISYDLSTASE